MLLIDLKEISFYRASLMGFAILWIMTFHFGILSIKFRYGYLGVDIFFFLSAIGLCFSLHKDPDIKSFYCRRFYRILPVWLVLITLHFIGFIMRDMPHPETVYEFFCYFTGSGWFIHPQSCWSYYCEWYVPTLLLFYILTPFLYKRTLKSLLYILVCSILIGYILLYLKFMIPLDRSYLRFPVFVSGFIFFKYFSGLQHMKSNINLLLYCLCFSGVLGFLLVRFYDLPESLTYLNFLLILPIFLKVLIFMIQLFKVTNCLAWIGTFTLELYLVHIYETISELLRNMLPFCNGFYVNVIFSFIVSILIAYFIHKLFSRLYKRNNVAMR